MNTLYFGDNLDILREYVEDESVDLVYLDPPFNSQAKYNLVFDRSKVSESSAQAGAFLDTWIWGEETEWTFNEIMKIGGSPARFVDALRSAMGESNMMAYIVMMTIRLFELHRSLKPTGSLYLHCDPTASHYLKILLDAIFGPNRYKSEIVWKRYSAHNDARKNYSAVHDTILYYSKGDKFCFNPQYTSHDPSYVEKSYRYQDPNGRQWRIQNLASPNPRPNLTYAYTAINGVTYQPHPNGWKYKQEKMRELDKQGRLVYPKTSSGRLALKSYLDETKGSPLGDVWADIKSLSGSHGERLGYPTQKPLGLLERVIQVSSNRDDVILDPFCGCGTTIEAAQRSGRQWIGIDIAIHAVKVIEARIKERIGKLEYNLEGIPRDFKSAEKLAENNKYQFQWWANYLFNPHALREQKKGPDRGIDGELFFPNGPGKPWGRMLTSVKGGANVGPSMVRDFRGVLEREGATMGLFICLYRPTRAMLQEAAAARMANTVHAGIPKLQIVALEDWFEGKLPKLPPLEHLPSAALATNRRRTSAKARKPDPRQPELPIVFSGGKSSKTTDIHLNPEMVSIAG